MGHFAVHARLTGPTGLSDVVELLVDTGATFIVLPRALADRLALRSRRTCRVEVAGGGREEWPLADLHIAFGALESPTPCLISDVGTPLLGAVALESLLLTVDPVRKRLVPTNALARATPRRVVAVTA